MLGGVDLSLWPSLQLTINCGRHPWHKWKLWKNVSTFCQLLIFFYSANYFVYILSLHFCSEAQYGNQALILPNLPHHVWHHLTHQSDYKLGNLNNSQSWEQPRLSWVLSIFLLWKVILEPWDLVISKRFKEAAVPSVLRVSKCVKNIISAK